VWIKIEVKLDWNGNQRPETVFFTWPQLNERTVLVHPQLSGTTQFILAGHRHGLIERIHQGLENGAELKSFGLRNNTFRLQNRNLKNDFK
jgi:hypothetical protein